MLLWTSSPKNDPEFSRHHQHHKDGRNDRQQPQAYKDRKLGAPDQDVDDQRRVENRNEQGQHAEKRTRLAIDFLTIPAAMRAIPLAQCAR